MDAVFEQVEQVAHDSGFSGVVRIDREGEVVVSSAHGLAHRALGVPNTVETMFAMASGSKALTALAVAALVADGSLELDTSARDILGADLPLVDDRVTMAHLLAHRSGIGDYLDESMGGDIDDYVMSVPLHTLTDPESYLPMLDGIPARSAPGEQFAYCNSGFVLLALIAQRSSGVPFAQLVDERVTSRAGMTDTAYLRSDELPARAALGYLHEEGVRTNVLHLPVCGGGDGGCFTTVADLAAFWPSFLTGAIVPPELVVELVRPRSDVPEEHLRYGLGFWLHATGPTVLLEGYDAGVSFRSAHNPDTATTWSVIGNSSASAWPLIRHLDERLSDPSPDADRR